MSFEHVLQDEDLKTHFCGFPLVDLFVFAKWWKADGMLLSSTWAGALCAEGHWNSISLLNNSSLTGRQCEILKSTLNSIQIHIFNIYISTTCCSLWRVPLHFNKGIYSLQTKLFSRVQWCAKRQLLGKAWSPFFPRALQKWSTGGREGVNRDYKGEKDQERRWRGKTENAPVTLPSWKVPQGKNVTQPKKV